MRAVICGYYGQGNAGDEALLVSLLQMLPPQVEAIALSANPQETQKHYGVKSCPNRSWSEIFQVLRQADVFIWGGGSLMQDVTSLGSPLYYGGLMLLAQLLGLKTIAWAQGIGPLNYPLTRWLTRTVLRRCSAISVRDQASQDLLKTWQVSALLAPDPVWLLQGQLPQNLVTLAPPRVAVNLRRHPQLTPARLELLTQALIDFQQITQANLLLIPFQTSQDLAIADAIAARLTGNYQILQRDDPRELKAIFQEVSLTIGMRLHSLIMAAAEGSRCFALSYDPKVSRLMAEVNLCGWELEHLPPDAAQISQAWQDCYTNGQPLSPEQRHTLIEQTRQHQALLKQVFQGLDDRL